VLKKNRESAEAHALGQLYFARGMNEEAIPHFKDAIRINDQRDEAVRADLQVLTLLMAKCYSKLGNYDQAESLAETAREHFAKRLDDGSSSDVESRIVLADTCMFLEDFPGASSVLESGLMYDNDAEHQKVLHAALARLNVAWADYVKEQDDSSEANRERRFELLNDALKHDPYHDPIFDRMMELLGEKTESAATAREYLLKNLTDGKSIGMSHLLLGSIAFEDEDPSAAEYHLERAHREMEHALVVMNNLAWFLAVKKNPPDLDRALGLIDNVLERAPNDPRYLDTRGQIYTKLERWDDAIADLERALQKGLSTPETHDALATCYGAKGVRDLEQRHEQKARPGREENR
jgi:tetratricopeptide (TPR) repeat protein